MDSSIIDLVLGSWGGTSAKKKKKTALFSHYQSAATWAVSSFFSSKSIRITTTQVFEEELVGASVKHRAKKNLK